MLEAGAVRLDLRTRRAELGGRSIGLSGREFILAETFFRHPGQVLPREQHLSRVWGYDFDPDSNIVDVYVGYLRRNSVTTSSKLPGESATGSSLASPMRYSVVLVSGIHSCRPTFLFGGDVHVPALCFMAPGTRSLRVISIRRHVDTPMPLDIASTMIPPHEISSIRYAICEPDDADEMGRLLAETFTRHDPPAVAIGITSAEFEEFVKLFSPPAGRDGLTIIARDVSTDAMAGALLTEDATSPPPEGIDQLTKKFDPIFDLLGQLDAKYRDARTVRPGEYLHLFLLGVAEGFIGRSIGQHLVDTCLDNGVTKGYRFALTEATNRVSQHIFRKLGFVEHAELSYRDYRRGGVPVFSSIAEHGGPMSMDRQLVRGA